MDSNNSGTMIRLHMASKYHLEHNQRIYLNKNGILQQIRSLTNLSKEETGNYDTSEDNLYNNYIKKIQMIIETS